MQSERLFETASGVSSSGHARKIRFDAAAWTLTISHSIDAIRTYCTSGLVIENRRLTFFPDVADTVAQHRRKVRE